MTFPEIWRLLKWRAIYSGPRRDVTVQTFNGLLTFESRQWLIGKYLYVRREHEKSEIEAVLSILESEGYRTAIASGTLINVGANIGMTVIALMQAGVAQAAVAIEPAPGNYRLLVHNIEQNGLAGKVQTVQAAISSSNGVLDLELSEDNSGDHRVRKTQEPGFYNEQHRRVVKAEAYTLDGIAEKMPFQAGLIWLDVQGHEGHVLRGTGNVLSGGAPVVSEFWPYGISRSGQTFAEFRSILEDLFEFFYVAEAVPARRPISDLDDLAREYVGPRRFCTLVLIPRKRN